MPLNSTKGQTFEEREKSDFHPFVEALVRVDPLEGAPCFGACLREGELASSPVGKASGELWSWPPLGVQSPSFPLTAPSYCQSVAREKKRG